MVKQEIKSTIKLLAYILLITLIADKVIYFALDKMSKDILAGQPMGKFNQYMKLKDDLDLIVYGSSRANHHIDVSKFSGSGFNMGVDNRSIVYFSTLIRLLPKEKKQVVILHLDLENIFPESYLGMDILNLSPMNRKIDLIKEETAHLGHSNQLSKIYWSIDFHGRVFGLVKNYFFPPYDYLKYDGYDPIVVREDQREIVETVLNRPSKEKCIEDPVPNPISLEYLDKLISFCAEHDKMLVAVTSPEYDDRCKEDNKRLAEILRNRNVDYFDFSDYFQDDNQLTYWHDKTHLSKPGAAIFSEQLVSTLKDAGYDI